jgi:bifunctional non-homologous end joining protein LigD
VRYALVEDELALAWMVDFGSIDLHVTAERTDRLDRPDYALFDLDPAGVAFSDVVRAALLLRTALEGLGLRSVVKTTGGQGVHVHVPLARRHAHDEVRAFCEAVASALARAAPRLVTLERSPRRRRGVYVDTKMNGRGQQSVAVYSLRPLPGAPVATPLAWEELEEGLDPRTFSPPAVLERVARHGDLFAPALEGGQRLSAALARLAGPL